MAATTKPLIEVFGKEIIREFGLYTAGRTTIEVADLTSEDREAIERAINDALSVMRKSTPSIARDFEAHKPVFLRFAQIAKAKLDEKPITYPSQSGTIGVGVLFPQAVKYTATTPTDYILNSWDINLTAGTPAYILGSATEFYKTSSVENQKHMFVIMKNGIVEVGSTPSLVQARIISESETRWGIWPLQPFADLSVETDKPVYQYNTIGVIPTFPDLGIRLSVMPSRSGTANIRLIGLVFYQHDLFPDLKWVV